MTRSRRGKAAVRNRTAGASRQPAKRPVDPSAHSLPGTALHKLALLIGEASRGTNRTRSGSDPCLHLRNPVRVSEDLKARLVSLGPSAQKRIAAKISADLTAPRTLPLDLVSLLLGVVLMATQRYWALPFVAYGAVALTYNSLARRRYNRKLLTAVAGFIRSDLQLISSDRTRAEGIAARYGETGHLNFLEGGEAPAGVQMPQGERVLLAGERVLKARESKGGLLREAEGKLLVTSARLLFTSAEGVTEMELNRVVRADVVDELRLVVTPSKREAPGIYFSLGNVHTFAEVIRLARSELSG